MKKGKLCLGLFSTGIVLTCTLLSLTNVAIDNEMLINDVLGLTGTKINKSARSSYADEDGNLTDEGYSRMIKDSYDFCRRAVGNLSPDPQSGLPHPDAAYAEADE